MKSEEITPAATKIVAGAFGNNGARCTAGKPVLIDASCYDDVVTALKAEMGKLKEGAFWEEVDITAPLSGNSDLAKYVGWVKDALHCGAKVFTKDGAPVTSVEGLIENGRFRPVLIEVAVDSTAKVRTEEVFGPMLVVIQSSAEQSDNYARANTQKHHLAFFGQKGVGGYPVNPTEAYSAYCTRVHIDACPQRGPDHLEFRSHPSNGNGQSTSGHRSVCEGTTVMVESLPYSDRTSAEQLLAVMMQPKASL